VTGVPALGGPAAAPPVPQPLDPRPAHLPCTPAGPEPSEHQPGAARAFGPRGRGRAAGVLGLGLSLIPTEVDGLLGDGVDLPLMHAASLNLFGAGFGLSWGQKA